MAKTQIPQFIKSKFDDKYIQPIWLVEINAPGGQDYYFGTDQVTFDGNQYLPRVTSLGRISMEQSGRSGMAFTGEGTVVLANPEYSGNRISDEYNTADWEINGSVIRIYLTFQGFSSADDKLEVFKAFIEDSEFDELTFTLKVKDAEFLVHTEFPKKSLIVLNDFVPEENRGLVIPYQYGDFGVSDGDIRKGGTVRRYMPAFNESVISPKFWVADHQLYALGDQFDYNDEFNPSMFTIENGFLTAMFLGSATSWSTQNNSNGAWASFSEVLGAFLWKQIVVKLTGGPTSSNSVSDWQKVLDNDDSTLVGIRIGDTLSLSMPGEIKLFELKNSALQMKIFVTFGTIASAGQLQIRKKSDGSLVTSFNFDFKSENSRVAFPTSGYLNVGYPTTYDEAANLYFDFITDDIMEIKDITVLFKDRYEEYTEDTAYLIRELQNKTMIGIRGQGKRFEDTWEGRRLSTYLIENPVDIIESLYRDVMGVPGTEINTYSFDVAKNFLSGWTFLCSFYEPENTQDIVKRLAFESKCVVFRNYNNQVTIVPYNPSKTINGNDKISLHTGTDGASAGQDTFTSVSSNFADVQTYIDEGYTVKLYIDPAFQNGGTYDVVSASGTDLSVPGAFSGPESGMTFEVYVDLSADAAFPTFTTADIIEGSFKSPKWSPLSDLANRFELHYNYDPLRGRYLNVLKLDESESNVNGAYLEGSDTVSGLQTLCSNSQTKYYIARLMTYKTKYISDEATATRLLQHLVKLYVDRKIRVAFDAKIEANKYEIEDFIKINHPVIPQTRFPASTTKYRILEIGANAGDGTVHIEAENVYA
jgi:hypothetical protein